MKNLETNLAEKSAGKMFGMALIGAATSMVGSINHTPDLMLAGVGAIGGSYVSILVYLKNQIKYGIYSN